jgi:hypothetical protein
MFSNPNTEACSDMDKSFQHACWIGPDLGACVLNPFGYDIMIQLVSNDSAFLLHHWAR